MSQDEFTKLFTYMSKHFDTIEKMLESKADKTDIERVLGLLDAHEERVEVLEDEKLAANYQIDRHEHWIRQLADRANYRLSP